MLLVISSWRVTKGYEFQGRADTKLVTKSEVEPFTDLYSTTIRTSTVLLGISSDLSKAVMRPQLDGTA